VHQLAAAGDQTIEFKPCFSSVFAEPGLSVPGKFDQHPGVDGIGLARMPRPIARCRTRRGSPNRGKSASSSASSSGRSKPPVASITMMGGFEIAQHLKDLADAVQIIVTVRIADVGTAQVQLGLCDVDGR